MTHEEFLKLAPSLVKNYRAAADVLNRLQTIILLMIVGPSGVGKTTLIENLGFTFVPSDTTRDSRPGEKQGVDMNFRKDYGQVIADMEVGRFVQVAVGASGDLYATKDSSYPDSGVATMPVMADVIPIFRNLGFKRTITAFIAPPTYNEWMRRIKKPGLIDKDIKERLPEAERSIKFALSDSQTHFILNDDLDKAVQQAKDLVDGKVDAQREETARKAAQAMLDGINPPKFPNETLGG
jgi:guanylate kinase